MNNIRLLYGLLALCSFVFAGTLYVNKALLYPSSQKNISLIAEVPRSSTVMQSFTPFDCVSFGYTWESGDTVSVACGSRVGIGIAEPEVYRYEKGQLYHVVHLPDKSSTLENPIPVSSPEKVWPVRLGGDHRYVRISSTIDNTIYSLVYHNEQLMENADGYTFSLIGIEEFPQGKDISMGTRSIAYSKDKNLVYYGGKEIKGADPETFEFIPTGAYFQEYAKDKNRAYYLGFPLEKSDPLTFKPFGTQPYEGSPISSYAVDKVHAYYKDMLIPGADVKTFEAKVEGYAKDKNNVYKEGVVVPSADPATFDFPDASIG